MIRMMLALSVALAALLVAVGSAGAAAPPCAIDEYGNCINSYADPTPAYDTVETGEDGGVEAYAANYHCRVVHAIRTLRNIYWVVLYQYVEQVRWCWDGSAVREFTRWRWPQSMTWGMWSFDGHIGSSCASEYCQEQVGGYWEHAQTQAQFHPNWCPFNFCGSRHPWVDIAVTGDGQWGANTGG